MLRPSSATQYSNFSSQGDTLETNIEQAEISSSVSLGSYPTYKVDPIVSGWWNDLAAQRVSDEVRVPFNATNPQVKRINELLAPIVIHPNTQWDRTNSHFYCATLLHLSEMFLDTKRQHSENNGLKVIEIGANFRKIAQNPQKHFCTLRTGRDEARMNSVLCEADIAAAAPMLNNTYHGCNLGAECCREPADVIIGNNVSYDLSFRTLERIFSLHGATVGYFAMILPEEFPLRRNAVNNNWQYTLHFQHDKVRFGFVDSTWNYEHKVADWHDWFTLDAYQGCSFSLLFERYKAFGPMCIIRVTRVNRSAKLAHNIIPKSTIGMTAVHNYLPFLDTLAVKLQSYWLVRKLVITQRTLDNIKEQAEVFYLPTEIVSKVEEFIWNRKDSEVDRLHAGAMLISACNRIIIGDYEVQRGIQFVDRNFDAIVMNIFIRALIQRAWSTKETGYFITQIQQFNQRGTSFGATCKALWRQLVDHDSISKRHIKEIYNINSEQLMVYMMLLGRDNGIDYTESHTVNTECTPLALPETRPFTYDPDDAGNCLHDCVEKFTITPCTRSLGLNPTEADVEVLLNQEGLTIANDPAYINLPISISNGHATISKTTADSCAHHTAFVPHIPYDSKQYMVSSLPYDADAAYYEQRGKMNKNCEKTELALYLGNIAHSDDTRGITEFFGHIQNRHWWAKKAFDYFRNNNNVERARTIINAAAAPFNDRAVWEQLRRTRVIHNVVQTDGISNRLPPAYPPNHSAVHGYNLACEACVRKFPACDLFYADVGLDLPQPFRAMFQAKVLENALLVPSISSRNILVIKLQHFTDTLKDGRCGTLMSILKQHYQIYRAKCHAPDEVFAIRGGTLGNVRVRELAPPVALSIVFDAFPVASFEVTRVAFAKQHSSFRLEAPTAPPEEYMDGYDLLFDERPHNVSFELYSPPYRNYVFEHEISAETHVEREIANFMDITITPIAAANAHVTISGLTTPPVTKGKIYRLKTGGSLVQEWRSFTGDTINLRACTVEQALQFTAAYPKVYLNSDHTGFTRTSEGGLFDLPADQDYGLPIFATPFHREATNSPMPVDAVAVYRSDIPNIRTPLPAGSVQIVDDIENCDCHDDIPFNGIITAVRGNHVYGPTFLVPNQPFTPVRVDYSKENVQELTQLRRELEGEKDKKFRELHKACADVIKDVKPITSGSIMLVEGTYGSGKTTMAAQMLRGVVDAVICPTKNLADEYKALGLKGYSWSSGLVNIKPNSKILIDEVFCIDPRIVWVLISMHQQVYAIGDRDQMRGGGKTVTTKIADLADKIPLSNINKRWVTFATPNDAVAALNTKYNMSVRTNSRVLRSRAVKVVTQANQIPRSCEPFCDLHRSDPTHQHCYTACFDTKHATIAKVATVATIQGLRKPVFNLFVSDSCQALIDRVHGQLLVSLSRHTQAINIYVHHSTLAAKLHFPPLLDGHSCQIGKRDRYSGLQGNSDVKSVRFDVADIPKFRLKVDNMEASTHGRERLERIANLPNGNEHQFTVPIRYAVDTHFSGIPLLPSTITEVEDPATHEDHVEILAEPLDRFRMTLGVSNSVHPAEAAARRVAPNSSEVATIDRRVNIAKMRPPELKRRIEIRGGADPVNQVVGHAVVPTAGMYAIYQENNTNHRLHTVTERYGANQRSRLEDAAVIAERDELFNGFCKFVDVTKFRPVTAEEVNNARAQALTRVVAKSTYPEMDLYGTTHASTTKISGFNKPQPKSGVKENADKPIKETNGVTHVKGGQPISAQPKTVNEIVAPYVYLLERQLEAAAKPGVFLGYGHSRDRFRRLVKRRLQKVKRRPEAKFTQCFNVDISEQDTTKNAATRAYNRLIFSLIGCPDEVLDILEQPNVAWKVEMADVKVNVVGQYQSGRPDTLCSNTTHSMGEVGRAFDWDGLHVAMFQGDDSHIQGVGIRYARPKTFLKVEESPVGSFLNYLITTDDVYLDIPRVAIKLLSREYHDNARVEELRLATYDLLAMHPSGRDRYLNQVVCAARYRVGEGDIGILYEYLVAYADPHCTTVDVNPKRGQAETVSTMFRAWTFK